jgi:hypothetical protein
VIMVVAGLVFVVNEVAFGIEKGRDGFLVEAGRRDETTSKH